MLMSGADERYLDQKYLQKIEALSERHDVAERDAFDVYYREFRKFESLFQDDTPVEVIKKFSYQMTERKIREDA